MPTFDIVSKIDLSEVDNAINGSMREISNRFDFKNSKSKIERENLKIYLTSEDSYKIDQVQQILKTHFVRRKLNTGSLSIQPIEDSKGGNLKQEIIILQGIDREISQKIVKEIKSSKLKVQISIRGEEMRVTGNKRDILQESIQKIKLLNFSLPLQFINFRD